jgi:hypothetical protein
MVFSPSNQDPRSAIPWTTGPTTSKIRGSCQACAMSKVKCHKERPTCLRCARRGITCEYLATKPPGRKRGKRDSNNARLDVATGQSSWTSTVATHSSPSPPRLGSVYEAEGGPPFDIFSGLLMPPDPSLSSGHAGLSGKFDKFYTSPIGSFEIDAPDHIKSAEERNDIEMPLIPDNSLDLVLGTASLEQPPASKVSSYCSNCHSLSTGYTRATSAGDLTCSCLMQALDLMKKHSSTHPTACGRSNSLENTTSTSNPSTQFVVMENKQAIKAVSGILQCPCAEDANLLAILSMIVFKLLGRYLVTAQKQLEEAAKSGEIPRRNASTPRSYYYDDKDLGSRIAAQAILSELHYVQRLVNQLTSRLKACGMDMAGKAEGGSVGVKDAEGNHKTTSYSEGQTTMVAPSAATLDRIEIELRRYLRTLSAQIFHMLQQSSRMA